MTEKLRVEVINDIINRNQLKNPWYLEIGVWVGETFKYVKTTNKDGVDPGQYCKCEYVNYIMTSDEFFKNHIERKYDIIFIDGLHTAYQVSKDIYHSILHLQNGGWIVLDDVYPHSEYEQESLNLRKTGAQTGDVWKAVYHVLDTIVDISDIVYFVNNTERGSLVFKVKENNTKNIMIDPSIPSCNIDGYYEGEEGEWNKYTYKEHFSDYIKRMNQFTQ